MPLQVKKLGIQVKKGDGTFVPADMLYNDRYLDTVNDIKNTLNYNKTATPGYVLRAKNSGTGQEWAQVGTPTDAQTAQAVSAWLDNHPEATTTVDFTIVDKSFPTVSEMTNDLHLEAGFVCKTNGYYSVGDGGSAFYRIVSTVGENDYYEETENGLYAIVINRNGVVEASQYGVIGNNVAADKITAAIQTAAALNFDLRFGCDFSYSTSIVLDNSFANRKIAFDCKLTYKGTSAAIIINNLSLAEIVGQTIIAENGIGIELLQNGNTRIMDNFIDFNRIYSNIGIYIRAETWGIADNTIHVRLIRGYSDGIKIECIEPAEEAEHPTFVGHTEFDVHLLLSISGYAINMITYATGSDGSTITGVHFGDVSFEGSANGLRCRGDCKMIRFDNLRTFEQSSFTKLIDIDGYARFIYINSVNPVMYSDKISINTTEPLEAKPVIIDGGILSPNGYRFAEKMIVGSDGETFVCDKNLRSLRGTDWTFMSSANQANWYCYNYFYNAQGTPVKLRNLKYFSPFGGIDTIYLNMNVNGGSVFSLYDEHGNLLFDGSTLPASQRALYKATIYKDVNSGTIKVSVTKEDEVVSIN